MKHLKLRRGFVAVLGIALLMAALLPLTTCNNLTMVESITELKLDDVNPIIPAWRNGYPFVESIDFNSAVVRFSLDLSSTIYYGVWVVNDDIETARTSGSFPTDLREWASGGTWDDTSVAETAITFGTVEYNQNDPYIDVEITGLTAGARHYIFATAEDLAGDLQPVRGLAVLDPVAFETPWISPDMGVDHIALHISESAILNGETARFVVRAENADGTVKADATGVVEIESSSTEIDPPFLETLLLENGIGYVDIPVGISVTGTALEAGFVARAPDFADVSDTVFVVDITGFSDIGSAGGMLSGQHYAEGNLTISTSVQLTTPETVLVIMPGSTLEFIAAMSVRVDEGQLFVLGTEDHRVTISGISGSNMWDGIRVGLVASDSARVHVNGAMLVGPQSLPLFEVPVVGVDYQIEVANSRIYLLGRPAFGLMSGTSGSRLTVENSVMHSNGAATAPVVVNLAGGSGNNSVEIRDVTITAYPATADGPALFWPNDPGSTWTVESSILGGDYFLIGDSMHSEGLTFRRNVLLCSDPDHWFETAFYPDNVDEQIYNLNGTANLWPAYWAEGDAEDFRLDPTWPDDEYPSTSDGVPASMVGSLTAGHPNEVGAYANFGYPPAP